MTVSPEGSPPSDLPATPVNHHDPVMTHSYSSAINAIRSNLTRAFTGSCLLCGGQHSFDNCPTLSNTDWLKAHYIQFCRLIRQHNSTITPSPPPSTAAVHQLVAAPEPGSYDQPSVNIHSITSEPGLYDQPPSNPCSSSGSQTAAPSAAEPGTYDQPPAHVHHLGTDYQMVLFPIHSLPSDWEQPTSDSFFRQGRH